MDNHTSAPIALQDMPEEAQRQLRSAVHDLNNALSAIAGYAQYHDSDRDDPYRPDWAAVGRAAARCKDIVAQLSELSRR